MLWVKVIFFRVWDGTEMERMTIYPVLAGTMFWYHSRPFARLWKFYWLSNSVPKPPIVVSEQYWTIGYCDSIARLPFPSSWRQSGRIPIITHTFDRSNQTRALFDARGWLPTSPVSLSVDGDSQFPWVTPSVTTDSHHLVRLTLANLSHHSIWCCASRILPPTTRCADVLHRVVSVPWGQQSCQFSCRCGTRPWQVCLCLSPRMKWKQ